MLLTRDVATGPGRSRGIALSVSVILNLFLLAVIGGYLFRPMFVARSPGGPMGRAIALVEHQLDAADAAAFDAVVRRDNARNTEAEQALITARDALEDDLAVEPFDQAKAKMAVVHTNQAFSRFVDSFSSTAIDALSRLSPAGRRKLVAFRRERLAAFDPETPVRSAEHH